RHAGIGGLTVGQRAGVGVATGERLYVLRLDPVRNVAAVGTRAEIAARRYALRDVHFTAGSAPAPRFASRAVLRYRGAPLDCEVAVEGDTATLDLVEPALVAPGQAVVWYDEDEVVGGGIVRAGGIAA
ncbi:MAG: aminomethyltransferase beta-barrel domain-containing protein, partial [Candidatus Limnocylindria bacterium]